MKYKPDFILVDHLVENLPQTQTILKKFKGVDTTVIEDVHAIKRPADFGKAKKLLLLTAHRGEAFKMCQGITSTHLCCNFWTIDLISNCPMDCSYCILQHYLENNPFLTIYVNADEILTRASVHFAGHADRKFRVSTGELSDSLALDHITGYSKKLIEYLSPLANVSLELKTKTDNIEHLLGLEHKGRTVISWSVNPQELIDSEERETTPLEGRFAAAEKALEAGYNIGFHFDPIIYSEKWEELYKPVAEQIVKRFDPNRIKWVSLGTLRFPQQMKDIVMKRFPASKIFYNELVPVDGKTRYFKPIREKIYTKMYEWLRPLQDTTPVYMCMETKAIWEKVKPDVSASNAAIERFICR